MRATRPRARPSGIFGDASERASFALAFTMIAALASSACASLEKAAAKDPMKCERDPSCKGHQGKSADCVTQCVDNPACIERCMSVSGQRR
jgi:hypothetical protein